MKRLILSVFLAAAVTIPAAAQNNLFEQFVSKSGNDYSEFKKKSDQEFEDFRDKANAEYAEFLRKAWEEFKGNAPMQREEEKPIVPPVVTPEPDIDQDDREIEFDEEIPVPVPSPVPEPIEPVEETPAPLLSRVDFTKYGTGCSVRFDTDVRPFLKGTDESSVADFWNDLSKDEVTGNLLFDFLAFKLERDLCDWAYYKFTEAFASNVYWDNTDAAELLKAYILTQSGFKLRIGYSKDDNRIHVLMALNEDVYGRSYWTIEGTNYYLFDDADINVMKVVSTDYTSSTPMSLSVGFGNFLDENLSDGRVLETGLYPGAKVSLSSNLNLLAFYDEFPDYASDFRWTFYAQTPLNVAIRETLYPQFGNLLKGKNELQAANIILNFVQTALVYKYDEEVWGRDRSFFAEESLYYPYCDCEDRSILFSHLIRDLLGLDVALIYSPGHLFAAVEFSEDVPGAYVMVGNRRFVICEPTCVDGAPVGYSGVEEGTDGIRLGLVQKIHYGEDYSVINHQ